MCPWCFETRWETFLIYGVLPFVLAFLIGAWRKWGDERDARRIMASYEEAERRRKQSGQP